VLSSLWSTMLSLLVSYMAYLPPTCSSALARHCTASLETQSSVHPLPVLIGHLIFKDVGLSMEYRLRLLASQKSMYHCAGVWTPFQSSFMWHYSDFTRTKASIPALKTLQTPVAFHCSG
ncbi:hypothetical protein C8F01DRAFT_1147223, partial [Mycena amicta]